MFRVDLAREARLASLSAFYLSFFEAVLSSTETSWSHQSSLSLIAEAATSGYSFFLASKSSGGAKRSTKSWYTMAPIRQSLSRLLLSFAPCRELVSAPLAEPHVFENCPRSGQTRASPHHGRVLFAGQMNYTLEDALHHVDTNFAPLRRCPWHHAKLWPVIILSQVLTSCPARSHLGLWLWLRLHLWQKISKPSTVCFRFFPSIESLIACNCAACAFGAALTSAADPGSAPQKERPSKHSGLGLCRLLSFGLPCSAHARVGFPSKIYLPSAEVWLLI